MATAITGRDVTGARIDGALVNNIGVGFGRTDKKIYIHLFGLDVDITLSLEQGKELGRQLVDAIVRIEE